jgi:hypothetical protein
MLLQRWNLHSTVQLPMRAVPSVLPWAVLTDKIGFHRKNKKILFFKGNRKSILQTVFKTLTNFGFVFRKKCVLTLIFFITK